MLQAAGPPRLNYTKQVGDGRVDHVLRDDGRTRCPTTTESSLFSWCSTGRSADRNME